MDKEPETYGEIQQRIGELHVEIQRLTQKILGDPMRPVMGSSNCPRCFKVRCIPGVAYGIAPDAICTCA